MSVTISMVQTRRCLSVFMKVPKSYFYSCSTSVHHKLTRVSESPKPSIQCYSTALSNLTKDQAQDMVLRLTEQERNLLLNTLKEYEIKDSNDTKSKFEGQLASSVWRSKFGRPTKLRYLGDVDPTGSYCAVPDDWLHKKFVEFTPQPSRNDLMKLTFINALPFVGFGFLDNFTMIIAGDYIEHALGIFMSISTMAAAALGNTISDVLGIGSAYYVERASEAVGVKPPKLTPIQLQMKSSRRSANMGRVLGITIGCLLGMCPLLFMDLKSKKDASADDAGKTEANTSESATVLPVAVV